MRRVTQQQWREHQEVSDLSLAGYRYDSRQVEVMEDVEIDTADLEPDLVRQPLQVRGGTVGYLEAVAGGEKETSELVTAVAGQLSAHLESLRLTAQTERALAAAQKRSEEMININHIVSLVATSLDVQESLQLIAIELAQTLDVPQVHVAIFDEDKTEMEIAAAFTSDDSLAGLEGDKYKVSSLPLYEKLLATRQTLRLSADEEMAEMAPIYEALRWRGVTGILLIPMMTGNKVLGAVSIHITDPEREISDDEQRIAETIVYQASTAVENARLFAQTQEALSEMAALSQIGAALNAAQNYEDVVTAVAGILRSRTNGSLRAALFHVDIDERERPVQLRLMSAEGSDLSDAVRRPIPVGEMPGFHLWQSSPEGVFLLGDVMSDPRLSERDRELFQQTETRSAALMPLRLSAQWVGFFGLLWTEPVVFTAEDERFYQSVEDELSLVVNNLQLLDATQRQARREQMLRRITSRVYAAPDAESILRAAAQEVQQALDLEAFAYLEEDPPAVGNGRTDGESAVAPDASAEQRI
jgi:GAF domain-containing protein